MFTSLQLESLKVAYLKLGLFLLGLLMSLNLAATVLSGGGWRAQRHSGLSGYGVIG